MKYVMFLASLLLALSAAHGSSNLAENNFGQLESNFSEVGR